MPFHRTNALCGAAECAKAAASKGRTRAPAPPACQPPSPPCILASLPPPCCSWFRCRHHHLQHVHPEASPRPLGAAVCAVGGAACVLEQPRAARQGSGRCPARLSHTCDGPLLAFRQSVLRAATAAPPPPPCCSYKEAFQQYISEAVLPSLRNHHDEHLLKQLKQRWDNHKVGGWVGGWCQGSSLRAAQPRRLPQSTPKGVFFLSGWVVSGQGRAGSAARQHLAGSEGCWRAWAAAWRRPRRRAWAWQPGRWGRDGRRSSRQGRS